MVARQNVLILDISRLSPSVPRSTATKSSLSQSVDSFDTGARIVEIHNVSLAIFKSRKVLSLVNSHENVSCRVIRRFPGGPEILSYARVHSYNDNRGHIGSLQGEGGSLKPFLSKFNSPGAISLAQSRALFARDVCVVVQIPDDALALFLPLVIYFILTRFIYIYISLHQKYNTIK